MDVVARACGRAVGQGRLLQNQLLLKAKRDENKNILTSLLNKAIIHISFVVSQEALLFKKGIFNNNIRYYNAQIIEHVHECLLHEAICRQRWMPPNLTSLVSKIHLTL